MNTKPILTLIALAALSVPAICQTVPARSSDSAPKESPSPEEAVLMSEFRVSATSDRGYVATQAAGATRASVPLIELAHTVNVLNEEFIKDTGAAKLYDALRYVSNVTGGDVRNDGDFGIGALGVRSFPINRMRDGMNITSASALVELSGYERVELIKGASAVLLGSSNPGGLINYVPKAPRFTRKTELRAEFDDNGHQYGSLDTTGPLLAAGEFKSAYRLVLSGQDSESWMDYHLRKAIFAQLGLVARFGNDTSVTLRFETQQERDRESIGVPYAYYVNPTVTPVPLVWDIPISFYRGELDDFKKAYTHIVDLSAETRIGADWILNFKSYAARAYTDRNETFILNPGPTTPITAWTRQTQRIPRMTRGLAAEINLLGRFQTGVAAHELLMGATFLGKKSTGTNERYSRGTINPLAPVYGVPLGAKAINLSSETTDNFEGIYLQDRVKLLNDRLILNAGVRWDHSLTTDQNLITNTSSVLRTQKWSPSYSTLYRITSGLSAYASYNENFQPAPPGTTFEGARFQPLQGLQYEAGLKFDFLGGKLSGNLATYQIVLKNSRTPDPRAPGFSVQGGTTSSNGYEADLAWSPRKNVQLIAGVSTSKFRRNAEIEVGAPVGFEPPLWQPKASFWGRYEFPDGLLQGFAVGVGAVYEGRRHPTFDRRFTVPSYTVVNGLISREWGRYRAALNIENILDERYVPRIEEARQASFGAPLSLKFSFGIEI